MLFEIANLASSNQNLTFIHKTVKLSDLNFCYLDKETVSILSYPTNDNLQSLTQIFNCLKEVENGITWLYQGDVK